MQKKKPNILIIITLSLLLLSGAAALFLYNSGVSSPVAKIYKNDKILHKINLNDVNEPYTIKVEDENKYNIIRVEKGKICMERASCPDKTCVYTGAIHNGYMPIVCLPNHVLITVEEGQGEYDAQTY